MRKNEAKTFSLVEAKVRGYSAGEVILRYTDEHDIDLVVMGTHGRRGPARLFLGSVAEEVVRHAPCPVLTLREEKAPQAIEAVEKILVPVDFFDASEEVERSRQQAEKLIGEVRELFPQVQEIMSGTSFGRDAIAKAEGVLQRAEAELGGQDARALGEVIESLERTLNMFRGVVSKTGLS